MSQKLTIPDFPEDHHYHMLNDRVRLDAYRTALKKVIQGYENIVEIGTGTGILARYASELTKGTVYAIEYFTDTINFAKNVSKPGYFTNISYLQNSSFNVKLAEKASVLVSETIGPIGPEERIVESCWDFANRNVGIEKFIPLNIEVWAQPFYSKTLEVKKQDLFNVYNLDFTDKINNDWINGQLELLLSRRIQNDIIKDFLIFSQPVNLAKYELGITKTSAFKKTINLLEHMRCNAIQFYFIAKLCDDIVLTSHINAKQTHWRHNFILIPNGFKSLTIVFNNIRNVFEFGWNLK